MVLTSDFRSGFQRERLRRSLFCCLLRVTGKGKGAPVRAPPAGGARPSRPLALRGSPLPTLCGGGAAARPACLRQSGKCGGWSPPPSRLRRQLLRSVGGGSGLRGASAACQPPAVAQGTPPAKQGQAPTVRATRGLALLLPRARCGVGAPARPGPHDVGALGPSAPPARSAALRHTSPAAPPPTAQALPLGAAYALAARRSRPSGLALSLVTRSAPSRPSGARPPAGG